MHSLPLSVHAKTEIATILFLPGKYLLSKVLRIESVSVVSWFFSWAGLTNGQSDWCSAVHILRYSLFFGCRTELELFYYSNLQFSWNPIYSTFFLPHNLHGLFENSHQSHKKPRHLSYFFIPFVFIPAELGAILVDSWRARGHAAPCVFSLGPINKCPGYLLLCLIFYVAFMVPIIPVTAVVFSLPWCPSPKSLSSSKRAPIVQKKKKEKEKANWFEFQWEFYQCAGIVIQRLLEMTAGGSRVSKRCFRGEKTRAISRLTPTFSSCKCKLRPHTIKPRTA